MFFIFEEGQQTLQIDNIVTYNKKDNILSLNCSMPRRCSDSSFRAVELRSDLDTLSFLMISDSIIVEHDQDIAIKYSSLRNDMTHYYQIWLAAIYELTKSHEYNNIYTELTYTINEFVSKWDAMPHQQDIIGNILTQVKETQPDQRDGDFIITSRTCTPFYSTLPSLHDITNTSPSQTKNKTYHLSISKENELYEWCKDLANSRIIYKHQPIYGCNHNIYKISHSIGKITVTSRGIMLIPKHSSKEPSLLPNCPECNKSCFSNTEIEY